MRDICDVSLALLVEKADREHLASLVRMQLSHEPEADPRAELWQWLYGDAGPRDPLREALGV